MVLEQAASSHALELKYAAHKKINKDEERQAEEYYAGNNCEKHEGRNRGERQCGCVRADATHDQKRCEQLGAVKRYNWNKQIERKETDVKIQGVNAYVVPHEALEVVRQCKVRGA